MSRSAATAAATTAAATKERAHLRTSVDLVERSSKCGYLICQQLSSRCLQSPPPATASSTPPATSSGSAATPAPAWPISSPTPRSTPAASTTSSRARKPSSARSSNGYLDALRPMIVDPAFATTADPVERIFAILAGYRERILLTDCQVRLPARPPRPRDRSREPPRARAHRRRISRGGSAPCASASTQLKPRLPRDTDLDALATYVLAIMEGGVMLSRSYGSVEPFDRTVTQLRQHFRLLLAPRRGKAKRAKARKERPSR